MSNSFESLAQAGVDVTLCDCRQVLCNERKRTMWKRYFWVFLAALLLACNKPAPVSFQNSDITGADFGRSLALTDHHGGARTLESYRGKAVVLFFGYASCPDVCPTTLSRFAEVLKALGGDAEKVQVLFVTLDPDRDTQEKLAAYVPWFHPSFIGLRGDAAATELAAKEFKIFYGKKVLEGGGYVIDHSAGAYVLDPAGRLRLFVRDDASVAAIVEDVKLLLAGK